GGVLLTLVVCVIFGILAGALAGWIGQWFYLMILFPIGIGIIVGIVAAGGVYRGKVRNVVLAGLLGAIGGCTAIATQHYVQYRTALAEVDKANPGAFAAFQFSPIEFALFIDAQAQHGVE